MILCVDTMAVTGEGSGSGAVTPPPPPPRTENGWRTEKGGAGQEEYLT